MPKTLHPRQRPGNPQESSAHRNPTAVTARLDVEYCCCIFIALKYTELQTVQRLPKSPKLAAGAFTVAATVLRAESVFPFSSPQSRQHDLNSESHIATKHHFSQEQDSSAVSTLRDLRGSCRPPLPDKPGGALLRMSLSIKTDTQETPSDKRWRPHR